MAETGATFSIEEIDHGLRRIEEMVRNLALRKSHVKAGILGGPEGKGSQDHGTGLTTVQLAAIHEFGAPKANVPERSFIRAGYEKHRAEYLALLKRMIPAIYSGGMPLERALGLIGVRMAADMKNYVTQGEPIPPPNVPEVFFRKLGLTATGNPRRKGGQYARDRFNATGTPPRTLVDTGRMVGSISHQVVMIGSGSEGE